MPEIHHPHSVLWGERLDPAGRSMVTAMPDYRPRGRTRYRALMNLELPALYAGYFGPWFGGLAR